MAVPKKKTSKMKKRQRRSHHALTPQYGIICSNCGEPVQRHRVCSACGYYKGKQALEVSDS
ncbi:MAG: 50S ribosomal protein L32 [Deltaproteobacteria bacterium]|nr:50S ribosomal protein L32 [Deltaproteobacteria bacterium]